MQLNTVARLSGLVGGLCWLARLVLDQAGVGAGITALHWAGLALLGLALVAAGAAMVNKGALWLRLVVGVAFPLLVWSVLEVLHPAGNPAVVDGAFGVAMALVAGIGLVRSRPAPRDRPRTAGAHAR